MDEATSPCVVVVDEATSPCVVVVDEATSPCVVVVDEATSPCVLWHCRTRCLVHYPNLYLTPVCTSAHDELRTSETLLQDGLSAISDQTYQAVSQGPGYTGPT